MEHILNELVDQYKEEMIEAMKEVIAIPSILEEGGEGYPFGKPIAQALDKVIEIGEDLGFESKNYDGYVGTLQLGNEGKQVAVLAHIDVVPVGEGWETPPFEATVKNNRIYGRGAVDDKGPMIASLFAMKAIKESGLPFKNHVRAIIGTDEESGYSRCLKYYLTKEDAPWLGFSPDADFPVVHAEKGILRFFATEEWEVEDKLAIVKDHPESGCLKLISLTGGIKVNVVPDTASCMVTCDAAGKALIEKARNEYELHDKIEVKTTENGVEIIAKGRSAHASIPWNGENGIQILLDFIVTLPFVENKVFAFAKKIHTLFGDGYTGERLGVACEDKLSGILTLCLGVLEIGETGGSAHVEIRYPIHASGSIIKKTLGFGCKDQGLSLEITQDKRNVYFPVNSPLIQQLMKAYQECTGRIDPPEVMGGGTYCRFVDNVVAFGPVFPGEPITEHEANEYIDINSMMKATKIYAQAIYALLNE